ncbi:mandelate racemase/muconate lactonizing enzyme family protein [Halovivax sp.]|uniref:mandelate racemase/muconate lactonizing enzyme family protein n=1 Tax=Halovivax sp. TaxID=1935978 RepID=UPI0025BCAD5F|nr:mandelate racemase/muconate lactonizing enzyme family protein [Halovivax sp.]
MQITGVTQHHLSHPLDGAFEPTWIPGYPQGSHEVELFEIETDGGITGLAASPSFAGGLDYADALSVFLAGEDPHDVRGIRRKLDSVNLIGPRPWHLEIALWDLIGKDAGKPIYELLGGTDDPIPVYASTGEVQPADERIAYVEERVAEGVAAVKLRVRTLDDLEIVREVRDAFPDLTLMVDANKGWSVRVMEDEVRWTYKDALAAARELEEIGGVAWLEEPLARHDYAGYARLREATDVPVAGGEFNDGLHHFREFADRDALDVYQPDAALATGILGATEVAGMAREHGAQFVPHTWTNGIGFVANLHVIAAVGAPWVEYPIEPPWTPDARDFLLSETLEHEDGAIAPPDGPGLGVELDEDALAEAGAADAAGAANAEGG